MPKLKLLNSRPGKIVKGRFVVVNPKARTTKDFWVLQGNYGYGWEDLTAEDKFKDIRQRAKEYRTNAPQGRYRVKLAREKITAAQNGPISRKMKAAGYTKREIAKR
jgi:hypothetical protein